VLRLHTIIHTEEAAMPLVRTNITLQEELLAVIDEVAGPRGRSAYIAGVLEKQARRDRLEKVWRQSFGALSGSTTWGTTDAEIRETFKAIRAEWSSPWPEDAEATGLDGATLGHDTADRLRDRPA
jgi:hypothetical protein